MLRLLNRSHIFKVSSFSLKSKIKAFKLILLNFIQSSKKKQKRTNYVLPFERNKQEPHF